MATERKRSHIKITKPDRTLKERLQDRKAKKQELKADRERTFQGGGAPAEKKRKEGKDYRSGLEIINGTRKRRRIIRFISYSIIAVVVITLITVNAATPTGLIETIQNRYAAMGKGKFPVNLYAVNADYFERYDEAVCAVNNSFFEVYNQKGKIVQAVSHGMMNPRLKMSEERFLLFDRERYSLGIYNYTNNIYKTTFENAIISADIGRDGSYAVVTESDSYLASVMVFDKDNKQEYVWNSANYYCTDVAMCDDGEKIAVCLVNAEGGKYVSEVCIFGFDSATPLAKCEFDGLAASVESVNEQYMLVNGFDNAGTVMWNGGAYSKITDDSSVRCFANSAEGICTVAYGRESNEMDNNIAVIGENGTVTANFLFNARINDVSISENGIVILADETALVYDLTGNKKSTITIASKPLFAVLTDEGKVLTVDNTMMNIYGE